MSTSSQSRLVSRLGVRLGAVLLAGAIAGGAWLASRDSAAAPAAIVAARALVAPGLVEPARDPVQLAFESPGRVAAILVEEGDTVAADQIVARLDDRVARARVAQAQAALAGAQARLDLARTGALPEEIAAARAELAAAKASASERAAARGRAERLAGSGALPVADADADIASSEVAAARVEASAAKLKQLERGTRVELRRAAQAEVAAAEAELAAAQVELDHTALRAPTAGLVLRRLAEPGALVTTTQAVPIVSIADVSHLELRAEIDETDVGRVRMGQVGWIVARAYGDRRFPGKVTRITRELGRKTVRVDDPRARVDTRVLEVVVTFDGGAGAEALPLGLRMDLHLAEAEAVAAR